MQSVRPKFAQEPVEGIDTICRQRISSATANTIRPDKTGLFKNVKMLRHGLLGDVEGIPKLTCGARGITHHTQDFAPTRLGESAYNERSFHSDLHAMKHTLSQVSACEMATFDVQASACVN